MAVDTVILSATNNWYYRWDNLPKSHSWSVVETDVPDGYRVSYLTSQMTVVITNTSVDFEEETTTNPEDTTTTPSDSTSPDDTTKPSDPTLPQDETTVPSGTTSPDSGTTKPGSTTKPAGTTETTTKPDKLIHTGQLNWPVPVFSIAGMILFSIGWAMLNLGKKDEETA